MNEIDRYDYELPRELIAQEPVTSRSDSRLMRMDRKSGKVDHLHVRDIVDLLKPNDVLVLNNTRVLPAKLVGYRKDTGGRWQGLFLQADEETGIWEVLTKTRGKLRAGEILTIKDRHARDGMELVVIARTESGNLLVQPQLPDGYVPHESEGDQTLESPSDWLERYGRIPLPPYIRDGQMVDSDIERYQTVFAKERGSVAAPTAGLHFTETLLHAIRKSGVEIVEVTLHVGIGTFRPIQVSQLDEHQMHHEWGRIDQASVELINSRREEGGRCIAVGTTSVRVLESSATAGQGQLIPWQGMTDLFIKPPYQFQSVDALITNFHLPKSSLLVLVSAFAERELILNAYQKAIDEEYRFFSYGDAMFLA
ncbi:tRNA preQ1(34) S-adenosylmethionine ribosyltransferase-isomerase QueA [bacterium]|nr:tRNA preQ1(34) S-adenosylmethionine ribosyltransferase-isomerase QueA [bacterium]